MPSLIGQGYAMQSVTSCSGLGEPPQEPTRASLKSVSRLSVQIILQSPPKFLSPQSLVSEPYG